MQEAVFILLGHSSHLYQVFDSVLVLGLGGRQLYFGPGGTSPADTLAEQGYIACPVGYSIPDYLLDLASDIDNYGALASASSAPNRDRTSDERLITKVENNGSGELARQRMSSQLFGSGNSWRSGNYSTVFLTQFEVLCAREWKNLIRFVSGC